MDRLALPSGMTVEVAAYLVGPEGFKFKMAAQLPTVPNAEEIAQLHTRLAASMERNGGRFMTNEEIAAFNDDDDAEDVTKELLA